MSTLQNLFRPCINPEIAAEGQKKVQIDPKVP